MEKKSKWKTWHKITLGVIAGMFILLLLFIQTATKEKPGSDVTALSDSSGSVQTSINWNTMKYEDKESWIKDYLKHPDDAAYQLIGEMNDVVKKQFNYPEEVDFNFGESPSFVNARIVDAATGTVFVEGGGTAKNAFGVKSRFVYSVRLKVTPDSLYIAQVSANEIK